MSAITAHCGCLMHLAYSRPLLLAGQKCLFRVRRCSGPNLKVSFQLASMKSSFGSADSRSL